ncbi:MAG: recombinase family protein [Atopobiaceae bacterium]|nr:recombinase family protein [Atopobiaceae bacterium]
MPSYGNRAAIYARYSSHNQREESIEIQVEQSRAYCDERGLTVVGEYCDYAQSGRSAERAEFQRMMEDARHGLFDHVVIWKVTRIMRNRDEMSLARLMLRKAGVDILYAGEQITEGSSGVLQLGMLEVLSEYESELTAERIRDGIHKNASNCMANGQPMFGWDIVDGRYVLNEREATALREARDAVVGGSTVASVARSLSAYRGKRGSAITQASLMKMLRRPQNAGTYRYAGVEVEGGIPAIWSAEEQAEVERVLSDRRRPHRYARMDQGPFALAGLARCPRCGRDLHGTCGTSKSGRRYSYYRCPKCRRTVRQEVLEGIVADAVRCAISGDDTRSLVADLMVGFERESSAPPRSEAIRDELRRIEAAYGRIWDAIESGMAPPGGRERIERLREREDALRDDLRRALAEEALGLDREAVVAWLETVAPEVPDCELVRTFASRVWHEFGGATTVAMAFDGNPPDEPPDPTPATSGFVFSKALPSSTMGRFGEHLAVRVSRRCLILETTA